MDRCRECGFVYGALPLEAVPEAVRIVAAQYRSRVSCGDPVGLRQRPHAQVWSPLEYAAHVRDVLVTQRERLALALRVTEPRFTSMRAEALVSERAYNDQHPAQVITELEQAADLLASLLDGMTEHEFARTGIYNWPVPAARDLLWIARHTVHELTHHLLDLNRVLQPTPGTVSG